MRFYVLTINYFAADWIAGLVDAIAAESDSRVRQFVVVNNAPADGEVALLAEFAGVTVLDTGKNLGFGAGCNVGLNWIWQRDRYARVWLLNPDTALPAGTLAAGADLCARHPDYAILGTQIYTPAGDCWFARGTYRPRSVAIRVETSLPPKPAPVLPCDWTSGCSMVVNLARFPECPQFDPQFFLYYEDFDFCRRYLAQGCRVGVATEVAVVHYPSSIAGRNARIKFAHATFSYLLAVWRYGSRGAFAWRSLRLLANAVVLLLARPAIARGKLAGIGQFWRLLRRERPHRRPLKSDRSNPENAATDSVGNSS